MDGCRFLPNTFCKLYFFHINIQSSGNKVFVHLINCVIGTGIKEKSDKEIFYLKI